MNYPAVASHQPAPAGLSIGQLATGDVASFIQLLSDASNSAPPQVGAGPLETNPFRAGLSIQVRR
jgi:hypothetical protein